MRLPYKSAPEKMVDGDDLIPLQTGDKVVIKKAWETARIIKLSKISFLETLREKMKGH